LPAGAADAWTVRASIDASKTGSPVSKHLYGSGLEMLDDRKFYYAITAHPPTRRRSRSDEAGVEVEDLPIASYSLGGRRAQNR